MGSCRMTAVGKRRRLQLSRYAFRSTVGLRSCSITSCEESPVANNRGGLSSSRSFATNRSSRARAVESRLWISSNTIDLKKLIGLSLLPR